jgi:hypothetical protein
VLVILALTRSELLALVGYLEGDLPRLCATPEGVGSAAQAGRNAATPIREALAKVAPILALPLTDRQQLDDTRDQLVEATKSAIGAIARSLDERLDREAIFEDDAARQEQSERLRRDLWLFREMCRLTAQKLEGQTPVIGAAEPLRRFATEFRDVGYQLLRHSDRELFDRFLDLLEGWSARRGESSLLRAQRLRDDCRRFAEILDRAYEVVGKRVELSRIPVDQVSYDEELARHLAGG